MRRPYQRTWSPGRAALFVLTVALGACATGGRGPTAEAIDGVVDEPPVDQVHWGLLAVDAESGQVLLARNEHRKFVPASNMKVLVTAAALHRLGPEHRFRTPVHAAGDFAPATGVVAGDLVVSGSGDPTLSGRYWDDDLAPLEALADSVVRAGVSRVEGRLVVDASSWDSTTVQGTWMVANLPASYSATGGAFAVAEGETRIVARGGSRAGEPPTVTWSPRGEPAFVVSYVETVAEDGDGDLDVTYLPESRRLVVRGTVPAGDTETTSVATRDPVRQATAALHRALVERGVEVRDGWAVEWNRYEPLGFGACQSGAVAACARAVELTAIESPPLMEIVEGILEPSQNWMTEQLVRALGASDSTRAGWSDGLRTVNRTLVEEAGVPEGDFSLRDGSGLSAYNLVTPRGMVAIFRWARTQPWGEGFRLALAEPGEEGSTLSSRLEEYEGRLWAKTGTISNVNSLSGYLLDEGGRAVVFSILTNGSGLPSGTVRGAMDDVVRALASSRAP